MAIAIGSYLRASPLATILGQVVTNTTTTKASILCQATTTSTITKAFLQTITIVTQATRAIWEVAISEVLLVVAIIVCKEKHFVVQETS